MSRNKRKESLVKQCQNVLDSKLTIGRSKHEDKKNGKIRGVDTSQFIYSYDTYKSYLRWSCNFVKWCKEKNPTVKKLEDCRCYVDEYLKCNIDSGKSSYTIKLQASALAKLYSCRTTDFIPTPARKRAEIKRGRVKEGRVRFSEEKHADLVSFCRCTGLRRAELEALRGSDLVVQDGEYFINVTRATKGGRPRVSPIVGTPSEIAQIVALMRSKGEGKVWGPVSSHANIHGYRADYAKKVYELHSRPIDEIKNERLLIFNNRVIDVYNGKRNVTRFRHLYTGKKDRRGMPQMISGYRDESSVYYCKVDKAGINYDRKALFVASQALGHNRESIIPSHYLM